MIITIIDAITMIAVIEELYENEIRVIYGIKMTDRTARDNIIAFSIINRNNLFKINLRISSLFFHLILK